MRPRVYSLILLVLAALIAAWHCLGNRRPMIWDLQVADRPAAAHPDYNGAVIPANIAPLNMTVMEQGDWFVLRIHGQACRPVEIPSRSSTIRIPLHRWRALLEQNRGRKLRLEILVRSAGKWICFEPLMVTVANADIDRFLVYRLMHPTHQHVASPIRIVCRDLTSFRQSVLMDGTALENACINCHSFLAGRPDQMLIGVRSTRYGVATLSLGPQGQLTKIAAKFGYTSWHPSGRLAAYSINNLPMFYHAARDEPRDTVDLDSMIACYNVQSGSITTVPALAKKELLETWPAWSADGRYLYYCCAERPWQDKPQVPPPGYDQLRYSLMRIAYDPNTDAWGVPQQVLSAQDLGKSIAMPRCSPDGRWVSFCGCNYGFFPAWQPDSDLYLLDLATGLHHRLQASGLSSQSWHCWSTNARFLVFSSKEQDGQFTRIMIAYIDPNGTASKPMVLPQEDPRVYRTRLWAYNTPELVTARPQVNPKGLYRLMRSAPSVRPQLPVTSATPKAEGFSAPTTRPARN